MKKFPTEEDFLTQKEYYQKKIDLIQKELETLESRKEKYYLVYIFVHRGNAKSGHYWGYGRNNENWYSFDLKCKKLEEN